MSDVRLMCSVFSLRFVTSGPLLSSQPSILQERGVNRTDTGAEWYLSPCIRHCEKHRWISDRRCPSRVSSLSFSVHSCNVDFISSIWHTGSHGFYDSQIFNPKDHKTLEFNWRGRFRTDDQGRYDLYCLRPTAYPIPNHYMFVFMYHRLSHWPTFTFVIKGRAYLNCSWSYPNASRSYSLLSPSRGISTPDNADLWLRLSICGKRRSICGQGLTSRGFQGRWR